MFARYNAQMIYVDGGGVGGGIVDRLRQLNYPVYEVRFGASADNFNAVDRMTRYANKRAEIWGRFAVAEDRRAASWKLDNDYGMLGT